MVLPPAADSLPASHLPCPLHLQDLLSCILASTLAPSFPLSQPPSWPQEKIPHTGNTRPSCTCVIQEY